MADALLCAFAKWQWKISIGFLSIVVWSHCVHPKYNLFSIFILLKENGKIIKLALFKLPWKEAPWTANPHGTLVKNTISKKNFALVRSTTTITILGCRDGAVVRALASHRCGPGSIPTSGVICGLSLLVSLLCTERFSPGTLVSPLL